MVPNPNSPAEQILEPLSKMTEVDACKTAQEMRERIKRLMYGSDITTHVIHSQLMDEFDKFTAKEGESLDFVYERLTTLVNIMDHNNICPISVAINTKFLNCLQPEWSKYVTMDGRVNIQTKNAGYGGNANKNAGRNRNQMFKAGIGSDESNQIVQRGQQTDSTPSKANVQCYNCNEKGHYAHDCQKPKVYDAKYFREQMLLAMKDEARRHLSNEENDFMLDTTYGEESLDELTASVMLMARLQPTDGNTDTVPSYDETAVSQVNDSSKAHEQVSHRKRKTIIQTTDDDQINSSIIFDDPYVANNGGTSKHDSITHEEYHEIQMLAYNVQREAENQKRLNNELKKQKDLLQHELETFKDRLRNDKDTIDQLLKEKDQIQSDCFKIENEQLIIQHETQLAKKVFQERENRYLEDIVDLEEKLSSHDRIVYKMGQSLQTIHMLRKKPNKVYDPFHKAGLGYQNPERLKKAIAAQPKMYDGDLLHFDKLIIDSPDLEGTLEDAKESRIKMRNKMVQINYDKINALYETFVPQQEFSAEHAYFSILSTSNNSSESKDVPSESLILKMPKESRVLKMIDTLVNMDREVSHVDISDMVSKEFAAHGPKMIGELFCQYM
ncbi:copia protein [Tanacetum coccineum]